jgi:hypothetical protein
MYPIYLMIQLVQDIPTYGMPEIFISPPDRYKPGCSGDWYLWEDIVPQPLYLQIADDLRKQIESGEIPWEASYRPRSNYAVRTARRGTRSGTPSNG